MPLSVLLVDDVDELRGVVRQALRVAGGFEVVAEAADGASALQAAREWMPALVVLDLGLPDLAGTELLTRLSEVLPQAQVVVYTGSVPPRADSLPGMIAGVVSKHEEVGGLVKLLQDVVRRHEHAATLDLGADHRGVAVARGFIAAQCKRWGCAELAEDAKLVLSELVTNALLHAKTRCEVRANYEGRLLRLEVIDHGTGIPDPQAPSQLDDHGRGLLLVTALCAAWGVDRSADGRKVVWGELTYPPILSRN